MPGDCGGEIVWWSRGVKVVVWPRRASVFELAKRCTTQIVATRGDAAGLIEAEGIAAVGSVGLIVNICKGAVLDEDPLTFVHGDIGKA